VVVTPHGPTAFIPENAPTVAIDESALVAGPETCRRAQFGYRLSESRRDQGSDRNRGYARKGCHASGRSDKDPRSSRGGGKRPPRPSKQMPTERTKPSPTRRQSRSPSAPQIFAAKIEAAGATNTIAETVEIKAADSGGDRGTGGSPGPSISSGGVTIRGGNQPRRKSVRSDDEWLS
jgi:hypothetical protein